MDAMCLKFPFGACGVPAQNSQRRLMRNLFTFACCRPRFEGSPGLQILQVTDPAIIAEALRNKDLDKQPLSQALNYFAGPHSLPTLLTSGSNERWKAVRFFPT